MIHAHKWVSAGEAEARRTLGPWQVWGAGCSFHPAELLWLPVQVEAEATRDLQSPSLGEAQSSARGARGTFSLTCIPSSKTGSGNLPSGSETEGPWPGTHTGDPHGL